MTCIRSEMIGFGHCLPPKVLTNDDLSKMVETNDEWIRTRTGILSRHVVENETTSVIAGKAVAQAIADANLTPEDVDVLILASITPDNTTPSTATKIAGELGFRVGVPAFDISAACSGFVYALTLADNMIRLGQVKTAVVAGAECLSKIVDWTDRNTCVLFGDGAGAVVLRAAQGNGESSDRGVLSTCIHSDGRQYNFLKTSGGASSTQTIGFVEMNGKEVFKHAVVALSDAANQAMEQAHIRKEKIDWLIPHQANVRIISTVGEKLGIPEEKVIVTLDHHGNTSAASIPLALSENIHSGKIKKGDLLVLTAMGAGFTWGAAVVRL
ncbi:MAG: ketoacyl-ACP synthase III [Alphaproteobacteria bacterium]|nr:ketoacyl-ACP synthase III [Alphaproteobacteria bacterium]